MILENTPQKKYYQKIIDRSKGDCLPACIATVTGIPLEEIPNFCEGNDYRWLQNMKDWLYKKGWCIIRIKEGTRWVEKGMFGGFNNDNQAAVVLDSDYPINMAVPSLEYKDGLHSIVGETEVSQTGGIYESFSLKVFHDPNKNNCGKEQKGNIVDYLIIVPILDKKDKNG